MEPIMNKGQRNALDDSRVAPRPDLGGFHMLDSRALGPELLKGMREIARFMEGTEAQHAIRRWYHITTTSNFPTFKLGSVTCALKSTIRAHIWMQQKKRAWKTEDQELLVRINSLLISIMAMIEPDGHANDNHDHAHMSAVMAETAKTINRLLHIGET
jgi:hypothetical protein